VGLRDLAVLDLQHIALASSVAEDGGEVVKIKVQSLGELAGGVTEESNLGISISCQLRGRV
jgi:hypothetical protein